MAIVVCKPWLQIAIATGYGTELILTDEICKKVIEDKIVPEFKKGKFYNGTKKCCVGLNRKVEIAAVAIANVMYE